jgi:hypothetical protein
LSRITSSLAVLALVICPSAWIGAQDTSASGPDAGEQPPALWEFRFAGFGRYAPDYPGAEESDLTLLPIPIPVYRGSFLSFGENLDQIARGDITETRRLRIGIDLDFTFGEDSSEIAARHGMPDLDFLIEIGPELEIRLSDRTLERGEFFLAWQLRAGISLDGLDSSSSRGFALSPEFEYRRDQVLGGDNLLSLRFRPTWASEDYMDYYYEVDPQYATLNRPTFDAQSGYLGSRITAALTRQINEKLVLGVSASWYLNSGAGNDTSPLFQSNTGASIQVALVRTLAESKRRAAPKRSR